MENLICINGMTSKNISMFAMQEHTNLHVKICVYIANVRNIE